MRVMREKEVMGMRSVTEVLYMYSLLSNFNVPNFSGIAACGYILLSLQSLMG